jgi:hypothetical protein
VDVLHVTAGPKPHGQGLRQAGRGDPNPHRRAQPLHCPRRTCHEQTRPLMEDFGAWLKTQRSRIFAKSRLGGKLSYIAKYMGRLKLFLDDGSVEEQQHGRTSDPPYCPKPQKRAVRERGRGRQNLGAASRLLSRPAS